MEIRISTMREAGNACVHWVSFFFLYYYYYYYYMPVHYIRCFFRYFYYYDFFCARRSPLEAYLDIMLYVYSFRT